MNTFFSTLMLNFFIALGVVLGGSLLGGIGAVAGGLPPLRTIIDISEKLKLWGLVSALGGTFTAIKELEMGFLGGELHTVIKQLIFIMSAFLGAHLGVMLVNMLTGGNGS